MVKRQEKNKKGQWLKKAYHISGVTAFYSILYTAFFSPVIFSGKLLAPGDAMVQSVPAFYSQRTLWTTLLAGGFPVTADPTVQTWYPLSFLFSLLPDSISWNAFVISAYVLASCFTYMYVYAITHSKMASLMSGTIYGMSGYIIARLGLTTAIHGVIWLPLILFALESLRSGGIRFSYFSVGVVAFTFCILAGHPQTAVYSFGSAILYGIVRGCYAPIGKVRYFSILVVLFLLGIGISSVQILPTKELAVNSVRAELSFNQFTQGSFPLWNWQVFLFPFSNKGHFSDFYLGILPIMFLLIGIIATRDKTRKRIIYFWLTFLMITFILALGKYTPVAQLMYHLPAYNVFRVPLRHFFEFTLAVAVLAGIGISTIEDLKPNEIRKAGIKVIVALMIILIIGVIYIKLCGDRLSPYIPPLYQQIKNFTHFNPVFFLPLLFFLISSLMIIWWKGKKNQVCLFNIVVLTFLIIDLAHFGFFCEWRIRYQDRKSLKVPEPAAKYIKQQTVNLRIAPWVGAIPLVFLDRAKPSILNSLPPNISRLYNAQSISIYTPLILQRYSNLLNMDAYGRLSKQELLVNDASLDILGARYLFMFTRGEVIGKKKLISKDGMLWDNKGLEIKLGGLNNDNLVEFSVPAIKADMIGIVSLLGNSTFIEDGKKVAEIRVTRVDGGTHHFYLYAGSDTSEWAYDRSDVRPYIRHKKAVVFKNFSVKGKDSVFQGHLYITKKKLKGYSPIIRLRIKWLGPTKSVINIHKLTLHNTKTGHSYPLDENFLILGDSRRWRFIENIQNNVVVYENIRAMPRAWLVPEVVSLKSEDVLSSIKSSTLADGRTFDPSKVALMEEPFNMKIEDFDKSASARIVHLSDTTVEIHTDSASPAFLVLSDVYYPGWKATIDGVDTQIFQTDYVLRGVMVPAGGHVVRFEFRPKSVYIGAGISVVSLMLLIIGVIILRNNQK